MGFDDLINKITNSKPFALTIKGKIRKAIFCASHCSEHYPDDEYLLNNQNDKQFVKKIYFGDIKDGESEFVFSIYGFADEFWILAILNSDKESDMHMKGLDIEEVRLA